MDVAPWQVIRPDDRGEPDDVVVSCDTLRLERMTDDAWWLAAYRGDERVCFWLQRRGKRIDCSVTEDTIGCTDDSTPAARAARDPGYAMELVMREW